MEEVKKQLSPAELRKILYELNGSLGAEAYNLTERIDHIYEFLTMKIPHIYSHLFKRLDGYDVNKIDDYKNKIILTICTDYILDYNYRVISNIEHIEYGRRVLKELEKNNTYRKVLAFFKNPINVSDAKWIIRNFFDYSLKNNLYINTCMDNAVRNNKIFKMLNQNPLFLYDYEEYSNQQTIESDYINTLIFELYDTLIKSHHEEMFEDKKKAIRPNITSYEYDQNSDFIDLDFEWELNPFYINLKEKIIGQFMERYHRSKDFNNAVGYIIGRAYEIMKLKNDEETKKIVNYIEENHNEFLHIIEVFLQDLGFSNYILCEFIDLKKMTNEDIILRRQEMENQGHAKVLKRYNSFYDIENERYGKEK